MFGKNFQKARFQNDYAKLSPKNLIYCPNLFSKKVASNLTAQICFKSSLRYCEKFFQKSVLLEFFQNYCLKKLNCSSFCAKCFPKKFMAQNFVELEWLVPLFQRTMQIDIRQT